MSSSQDSDELRIRALARQFLRIRKAAEPYLGQNVASAPGLELLLATFSFETGRRSQHLIDVARIANVPRTTAVRWLRRLQQDGFVVLSADTKDKRAIRVTLSSAGIHAIRRTLIAVRFVR